MVNLDNLALEVNLANRSLANPVNLDNPKANLDNLVNLVNLVNSDNLKANSVNLKANLVNLANLKANPAVLASINSLASQCSTTRYVAVNFLVLFHHLY